jgi:hypothetical protein
MLYVVALADSIQSLSLHFNFIIEALYFIIGQQEHTTYNTSLSPWLVSSSHCYYEQL